MIDIDLNITPAELRDRLERMWQVSAEKIRSIAADNHSPADPPVVTVEGKYQSRPWTHWTQGFVVGSALLQYDASGSEEFLALGREATRNTMAPHVTHHGVHDHGFNNLSTYGNLWRLAVEGRLQEAPGEMDFWQMALKASAATQASRWTQLPDGQGYIYSFNGPHSLFADTIRSCRILAVSWKLGHVLLGEGDRVINLLHRMVCHLHTTAAYSVYYGKGRDTYDLPGRVVHECIFNCNDGRFRCPSSQQGYSPFTTWTRGLAWIMLGAAEQLEFLDTCTREDLEPLGGPQAVTEPILQAARATCDFYIQHTPTDGICYWDTGAPGLAQMGAYLDRPADPHNDHEPVDSSASAIAAQGLLRLGTYLAQRGDDQADRYRQAGLTVAKALLGSEYLSEDSNHQGLLLHSVYHRPNGWDHIPAGRKVPCDEASMWGDYHLRELGLYLQRLAEKQTYLTFFGPA